MKNVPDIGFTVYHCALAISQTLCLHGAFVSFLTMISNMFSPKQFVDLKRECVVSRDKESFDRLWCEEQHLLHDAGKTVIYWCRRSHCSSILVPWLNIAPPLNFCLHASSQGWHNGFSQWWTMQPSKCPRPSGEYFVARIANLVVYGRSQHCGGIAIVAHHTPIPSRVQVMITARTEKPDSETRFQRIQGL